MTFGASRVEAEGLLDHRIGRPEEGRIGLDREAPGATVRGLEGGQQQRRGADAHLGDDRPRQLALRPGRLLEPPARAPGSAQ